MNGLKMHLRELCVGRTTFRVATLRAQTTARFSMNFFHGTWHILTDADGAQVLGRLLWALSFQRMPGTCVLIDGEHLVTTPFDANPALPILLMQDGPTRVDHDLLAMLRARIRTDASGKTIRFHTFSMATAKRERDEAGHTRGWTWNDDDMVSARTREKMQRLGGFLVYSAPPVILRAQALTIHGMRPGRYPDYHYLAEGSRHGRHAPDGEVQVFSRFKGMVSAAKVARREELGPLAPRDELDENERTRVQRRAEQVCQRMQKAKLAPRP